MSDSTASHGRPKHAREAQETPQDFADAIPNVVEGDQSAKKSATSISDEKLDRSHILGRDGRTAAGWALRFIVIVAALYVAQKILSFVWVGLLPVILALLVSTVLWPVARLFRRIKFPAALASAASILLFFAIFAGAFSAMAPSVSTQGKQIYEQSVQGIDQLTAWVNNNPFGIDTSALNIDKAIKDGLTFLQDQSQSIATGVFAGVSAAGSGVVTMLIMLVVTFFMLKDGDKFLPMVRNYAGANAGWHLSEVFSRTWNTLSGFIRTQALVSFIDAIFIGVGLLILQVPLALVLATLTFFAGFVPIVGAITAGGIAVLVALVTQGPTTALLVLGLIILVQQLEGNILQPILQSKAMDLHAVVVLLSVTVGSTLFGIIGAFLAVPIAATVAVWFRYHAEMVSLRSGEITVDDVELATAKGRSLSSREAFVAMRDHLKNMGVRKGTTGSTAVAASQRAGTIEDAGKDSES